MILWDHGLTRGVQALRLWMMSVLPSGSKIIAMWQTGVGKGSMRKRTPAGAQVLDGGVEVLDLQRDGCAVRARIPTRRRADAERVRSDFIFDPLRIRGGRGLQPEHPFVEGPGAGKVGDGVGREGDFGGFDHGGLGR